MENRIRLEKWLLRTATLVLLGGAASCTKGPSPEELVPDNASWAVHVWMPGVGWELLTQDDDTGILRIPQPADTLPIQKPPSQLNTWVTLFGKQPLQSGIDFSGALWLFGTADEQIAASVRLSSRAKWEARLEEAGYGPYITKGNYGRLSDSVQSVYMVWSDHTVVASNRSLHDSVLYTRHIHHSDWKQRIAIKAGQPEAMVTAQWLKNIAPAWLDSGRVYASLSPSRSSVKVTLHTEEVHGEAKSWLTRITKTSTPVQIPFGLPVRFHIGFALEPSAVDTLLSWTQQHFPDVFSFAGTSYDSAFRALINGELHYTRFADQSYHLAFGVQDTVLCDHWLKVLYDQGVFTSIGMQRYSLAKLYTVYRDGTLLHWGNAEDPKTDGPPYTAACLAYPALLDSATWGLLPAIPSHLAGKVWYAMIVNNQQQESPEVELNILF